MGSFFLNDFIPTITLNDIRSNPIENGRRYLSEFFTYFGITDKEKIKEAVNLFEPRVYKKETHFLKMGETAETAESWI